MLNSADDAWVDGPYLLEKYPGKGGWTYAQVPEIQPDPHAHFGWVRVKGSIDHILFEGFKLMPIGNGQLFFSVKKAWRQQLGKEAGDWVHLRLYPDPEPKTLDPEFEACLRDIPEVWMRYNQLSEVEVAALIKGWHQAKSDPEKVHWIAKTLEMLGG